MSLATLEISEEQRLFIETNGYLVIRNALPPAELERLRTAADRAERAWRRDPALPGWRRDNIEQLRSIVEYGDEFVDLAAHSSVIPVVRAMLGDDLALMFSDYFITPPRTSSQIHWHRDARLLGPYHPRSRMFAKVFFMLSDVEATSGPTAIVPGSHKLEEDWIFPAVDDPADMPGHVKMSYPAGTAWVMHGRTYHSALPNHSDIARRMLVYCYGHIWMKPWQGYEPSTAVQAKAGTAIMRQLFHVGDPYRYRYELDDDAPSATSAEDEYQQRKIQKQGRGLA